MNIKGSRIESPDLFASRGQFTDEKGFAKIVFKVKKALQKFIKEINNIIADSTNAETKALRDDVVVLEFIQSQFERILDEVNEKRIQNAKQSAEAAADKGENVNSAVVSASRMEMNIESVEEAQKDITAAYRREVDNVLNGTYNKRDTLLLGYTPKIYRNLGAPALPFVIR